MGFLDSLESSNILLGYKHRNEVEPSWLLVTTDSYPNGKAIGVEISYTGYGDILKPPVETTDLENFMGQVTESHGYQFFVMKGTKEMGQFMLDKILAWEQAYPAEAAALEAKGKADEAEYYASLKS